ncbi:hypothetical protein [Roseateles sp.]|uniref:hypothetical protein n=1 Tax=Roseateles sp. TaxID=1971397 RepID=UPI0031CF8379
MTRHRITKPSASLDLIAKANGQKTGDELRLEARDARHTAIREMHAAEPRPLTSRERCRLRAVMKKAGKDLFGKPLETTP